MTNLLSPGALWRLIDDANGPAVRLLDVRWRLDKPDGRAAYLEGHLPGAVYVDLDRQLARAGEPREGRHPLPRVADLQEALRSWGVNDGDVVVAYDDVKSMAAARAWWLLRRGGIDVHVLDGGLRGWTAAGFPLETGEVGVPLGSATLRESEHGTLTIEESARFAETGILLDVRAPERYRGEVEPLDPRAGHIPGAVNLPVGLVLEGDGRLRDASQLAALFADAGIDSTTPVATYCGSGITAAHAALALAEVGIEASVFPGSWSQWSNTPGRPVAVGSLPSGDVLPNSEGENA